MMLYVLRIDIWRIVVQLAEHYDKVVATDVTQTQLEHAVPHPKVTYTLTDRQMTDEQVRDVVGENGSVDLVICAQSLHWFNLDSFYGHARRVLRKPGGVIAAWCYRAPSVSPAVDTVLAVFDVQIQQEWAPEVAYVRDCYKSIPFPFAPVAPLTTTGPFEFEATKEASLSAYLTHLRSWSAVQKAIDDGRDVWSEHQQKLFADAWGGSPETVRTVKWTLYTVIGTV